MSGTGAKALGAFLLAAACTAPGTAVAAEPGDVAHRIEALKVRESDRAWQQIPWLTDLAEGQRQAQRERRPILLWVSGDDPLERC